MFPVNNIIKQNIKKDRSFVVVCSNSQEYAKNLGFCEGETFYILRGDKWSIPNSDLKDNVRIMKTTELCVCSSICAVICLGALDDFDIARSISHQLGVPLVQIHTTGMKTFAGHPFSSQMGKRPNPTVGDVNVSLLEEVSCFVEPELKKDTSGEAYMSGDAQLSINIPNVKIELEENAIPKSASVLYINTATPPEVLSKFNAILDGFTIEPYDRKSPYDTGVFIETWVGDTIIPLEIMQRGGVVFLPYSEESNVIIQDGENGFLYNDLPELHEKVRYLTEKEGLFDKIGKKAKESSIEFTCDKEYFRSAWEALFNTLQDMVSKVDGFYNR
tara:strand:- start:24563 stop:25552 length:990 start_codon:yes stop_codon:yes gene_type:complete